MTKLGTEKWTLLCYDCSAEYKADIASERWTCKECGGDN